MSVEQVLFYFFAAIAVASAVAVITLRNVVHSAVAGDKAVKALDVFHPIREDYR